MAIRVGKIALWFAVWLALNQCTPVPAVKIATVSYKVYLPIVSTRTLLRGSAMTHWICADAYTIGAKWLYNWYTSPLMCNPLLVESVPMIRDASMMGNVIGGNSDYLLGFNEPDRPDQSNLTPQQAVPLWMQIESRFLDRLLVAPVPSHENIIWLEQFRNAFIASYGRAPRLDALALHCYFPTAAQCIGVVNWFIGKAIAWGVPEIWITEFSFRNCGRLQWQTDVETHQFVNYLQHQPIITRYAWFTNRADPNEPWLEGQDYDCAVAPLFNLSGVLSPFGAVYGSTP